MTAAPADAAAITRGSKSNLALAFVALPRERRDDITVFYAWCRVIDDIADDPGDTASTRRAALDVWRRAVEAPTPGESPLAAPVREIIARHGIPVTHFHEIIAGVEMDIDRVTYETWEELRIYCHRVASVVGLVSIAIFGARDPACRQYALDLGLALQLTNILRDVGQDFANDRRIYLPRQDMARFGYTAEDLASGLHNPAFLALMTFEARRARDFYTAAERALPAAERGTMVAAEIMRAVYSSILQKMERDGFRVFDRRYRLSKFRKMVIVASQSLRVKFHRTSTACPSSENPSTTPHP